MLIAARQSMMTGKKAAQNTFDMIDASSLEPKTKSELKESVAEAGKITRYISSKLVFPEQQSRNSSCHEKSCTQ